MSHRVCKSYKVLVGMEIHVQLATKSKMFTAVANASGSLKPGEAPPEPNTAVDEQVLGLPGVLPVMNRKAVEYSIKVGLALGCKIARHTKWDRKSYYYPDLPKNYQISQYDMPLCYEGEFEVPGDDGPQGRPHKVRIRRAHLEEDAGKLLHEAPGGYAIDHSIVDLNRAGTPLLEIVTEPDLETPEQVRAFGQELQKLVQHLGVSEAQMQLGHMRFEPNINVHITDDAGAVHKTAITEIKNLNSFAVLEKATAYEVRRQVAQWEETGSLGVKSTYGWDPAAEATYFQRVKEDADDYRYFPDPDLPPVEVGDEWLAELKGQIGELPAARRKRYGETAGLNAKDAALLAADRAVGDFFDGMVRAGAEPKRASTVIEALREIAPDTMTLAESMGASPDSRGVTSARAAEVAKLVEAGRVAANKHTISLILQWLANHPAGMAEQGAAELGLIQVSDTAAIDVAIDELIVENPKSLQDFLGGKDAALGSLVGMIMKKGKGFNAKIVRQRLDDKLKQGN